LEFGPGNNLSSAVGFSTEIYIINIGWLNGWLAMLACKKSG
jgi:hypothetical protein